MSTTLPDVPTLSPFPAGRCSASLLRRLAQAVDGHRGAGSIYFVGRYEYSPAVQGHNLAGPFTSHQAALDYMSAQSLSEGEHGIFGPFDASVQSTGGAGFLSDTVTEPETVLPPGAEGAAVAPKVDRVHVEMSNGQYITFAAKHYDALFWSGSARDKFLIPYYVTLGSLEEGVMLRDSTTETSLISHRPGSRYVSGDNDPGYLPESPEDGPTGAQGGIGLYLVIPGDGEAEVRSLG